MHLTYHPGARRRPPLLKSHPPPTQKKTPPVLPTRTTPTLTKKTLGTTAEEPEPDHPAPEVEPKPEVVIPSPPQNPKAGEQPFDYNRVCRSIKLNFSTHYSELSRQKLVFSLNKDKNWFAALRQRSPF